MQPSHSGTHVKISSWTAREPLAILPACSWECSHSDIAFVFIRLLQHHVLWIQCPISVQVRWCPVNLWTAIIYNWFSVIYVCRAGGIASQFCWTILIHGQKFRSLWLMRSLMESKPNHGGTSTDAQEQGAADSYPRTVLWLQSDVLNCKDFECA